MIGFKRNQNPYNKLGVGLKVNIINWFKEWAPDIGYNIDDNLNITIDDLDLYNSNITELPDNLTINGSLNLYGVKITKLPNHLIVNEFMDLRNTRITELPDNLIVNGLLGLSGTMITKLPDNLKVG